MTRNPLKKSSKAFVLIIPLVTQIYLSELEVVVRRSRTLRGVKMILLQMIQIYFGEWEVAVVLAVYCSRRRVECSSSVRRSQERSGDAP